MDASLRGKSNSTDILPIFPRTAKVDHNHLLIGGCDTIILAQTFGTPLYVFDDETLKHQCDQFLKEFRGRYSDTGVIYACKAFVNPALASILKEEGLGLDVCSGGEISVARQAAFPPEQVYFHGNNKSREELELALEWGIGRIVVDNFQELATLGELALKKSVSQDILLRLSPGIDPHTHRYTATGILDSKFGFPTSTGQAEEALSRAMAAPALNLVGLHFHLGSQILEQEPYREAIEVVLNFAAEMRGKYGFQLSELGIGGGFAIQYERNLPPPTIAGYAQEIASTLIAKSRDLALKPPRLVIEPGRAIVGRAGVAIYSVGGIKDVPGVRKYILVDGGMGDNIRPALYGSRYEALVANKAESSVEERVTIAGKFCESGDVLIQDIELPKISIGDIIAIPACGAYCLPLASNYNLSLKPAIVLLKEGKARLSRRRETYQDIARCDLT